MRPTPGRAYQVNVTSPEAVDKAINEIVQEFNGRLDVFVANSGIAWEEGTFLDGSAKTAERVMSVNVNGVMWCAKAAGAHFRRQKKEGTTLDGKPLENYIAGSFIATASISGSIVNIPQRQAVYNASKAAVIHFCESRCCCCRVGSLSINRLLMTMGFKTGKSMAVEWTGFARSNLVSPGYTVTEITHYLDDAVKEQWKNKTPMGYVHIDLRVSPDTC